nr:HepT-like ribonuclease domain-containing protein [Paracoccus sediminis]
MASDHPDFANAQAAIPWRGIRGMRNRIAHGSFDIAPHVVWTMVQAELPALIKQRSRPKSGHSRQRGGSHENGPTTEPGSVRWGQERSDSGAAWQP